MAKGIYLGVGNLSKKVKKLYVGIGGVSKKAKKVYMGVNGAAKLCWTGFGLPTFTGSYAIFGDASKGYIECYSSGNLTVSDSNYDVFLVGGGASGSCGSVNYGGAGGGAGYTTLISNTLLSQNEPYALIIGSGGAPVYYTDGEPTLGKVGGNTVAFGQTASGGKAGSEYNVGGDGGSGGGSGASKSSSNGGNGGTNGGNGAGFAPGTGAGISTIFNAKTYAGGGGGGGLTASRTPGAGGDGGGGKGGYVYDTQAVSGTPNTGGGGGGTGGYTSAGNSGAGGSGIVIIRWGY